MVDRLGSVVPFRFVGVGCSAYLDCVLEWPRVPSSLRALDSILAGPGAATGLSRDSLVLDPFVGLPLLGRFVCSRRRPWRPLASRVKRLPTGRGRWHLRRGQTFEARGVKRLIWLLKLPPSLPMPILRSMPLLDFPPPPPPSPQEPCTNIPLQNHLTNSPHLHLYRHPSLHSACSSCRALRSIPSSARWPIGGRTSCRG